MSAAVNYASKPLAGAKVCTLADTSRTAPATGIQTLVSTVDYPNGAQIERLKVIPVATNVATVMRFWLYDGAAYHLAMEIGIQANTLSGSVEAPVVARSAVTNPDLFPLMVPLGWDLRVTMNDANTGIQAVAEGGGF